MTQSNTTHVSAVHSAIILMALETLGISAAEPVAPIPVRLPMVGAKSRYARKPDESWQAWQTRVSIMREDAVQRKRAERARRKAEVIERTESIMQLHSVDQHTAAHMAVSGFDLRTQKVVNTQATSADALFTEHTELKACTCAKCTGGHTARFTTTPDGFYDGPVKATHSRTMRHTREAQDILASLTERFSKGFSSAQGKIRRPRWMDVETRVFDRIVKNERIYRAMKAHDTAYDPASHVVSSHVSYADGPYSVWPIKALHGHKPCLQGNKAVNGTQAEALASGGQRSDAQSKVHGISAGDVRLSKLWRRVQLEPITVAVTTKNPEGKISFPPMMVSSGTGNFHVVAPEHTHVAPTSAVHAPEHMPATHYETSWTMTLARVRYGLEPVPPCKPERLVQHSAVYPVIQAAQYAHAIDDKHDGPYSVWPRLTRTIQTSI